MRRAAWLAAHLVNGVNVGHRDLVWAVALANQHLRLLRRHSTHTNAHAGGMHEEAKTLKAAA